MLQEFQRTGSLGYNGPSVQSFPIEFSGATFSRGLSAGFSAAGPALCRRYSAYYSPSQNFDIGFINYSLCSEYYTNFGWEMEEHGQCNVTGQCKQRLAETALTATVLAAIVLAATVLHRRMSLVAYSGHHSTAGGRPTSMHAAGSMFQSQQCCQKHIPAITVPPAAYLP